MAEKQSDGQSGVVERDELSIRIPVRRQELGVFISGLLGQPQSVEKEFDQPFDIDHAWLMNLHEVIDQRVKQQSEAYLTSFKAVVYLEGKTKRNLTSLEQFQTYNELQQKASEGVRMEWTYLVRFPNKQVPEKQEISFHARANIIEVSGLESPIGDP